jgi:hypothetical protein
MSTGTLIREVAFGTATKGKLADGSSVLQEEKASPKPTSKGSILLQAIKKERVRMVLRVRQN